MQKRRSTPAETLVCTGIWGLAFTTIVGILVGSQWLAWNGPRWMMSDDRLGIGVILAVSVAIIGVVCVSCWLTDLFYPDLFT